VTIVVQLVKYSAALFSFESGEPFSVTAAENLTVSGKCPCDSRTRAFVFASCDAFVFGVPVR